MLSAIVDGKVLDYRYKPYGKIPQMYHFFVGDIYVGIVSKRKNTNWNATVTTPRTFNDTVSGFVSRESACEFMLQAVKIEDYYKGIEKEKKDIEESMMGNALIDLFKAYTNEEVSELHPSVKQAWIQGLLLNANRERDENENK